MHTADVVVILLYFAALLVVGYLSGKKQHDA